ncbi:MAG: spore coat protein CotJB [Eubacteriales bacterium]|nr:spore coat protein CotJB [Eubacteriales bacterium]
MMQNQSCNYHPGASCRQGWNMPSYVQPQQQRSSYNAPSRPSGQMSREQLLEKITLAKFACVDANLYLDTHPDDTEALRYFQENNRIYVDAMNEYARLYGPLTVSHAQYNNSYWDWVNQPWPWQTSKTADGR